MLALPSALAFSLSGINEKRLGAVGTTGGHQGEDRNHCHASSDTKLQAVTHSMGPDVEHGTNVVRREMEVSRRPDPLSEIDFDMPKSRERLSLVRLAQRLDQELFDREWFVTGHVNPKYFHPDFYYEDADVVLHSLEEYARDVHALFDQSCSRAEVVETKVSRDRAQTITCTWCCSGRANLLWGIDIKPFMVTTNWEVDRQTGLISKQFDEYSLPQWDLLVSAIFPFLNGIITAPPAPPVPPRARHPPMAATVPRSPLQAWASKAGFESYFSRPKRRQRDTGNPLDDFVDFLSEDKNNFFNWKPPAVDKKKLVTPEIETTLPTIRAPTLWDRMQAFAPDSAELVENLTEATRRTESRRSRRYYVSLVDPKQEEKAQESVRQQDAEHVIAP